MNLTKATSFEVCYITRTFHELKNSEVILIRNHHYQIFPVNIPEKTNIFFTFKFVFNYRDLFIL